MPNVHPGEFDCRPQAVDSWLKNLPRASIGKTAELLYKALQSIDAQPLKAADRFQTLEKLRESVHYVSLNMKKHFAGVSYPIPDKILLISGASQSIFEYMARGYRQVFYELQKQSFLFVDKKVLTTTVHRSITYLNQCLLIAYEIYSAYHKDYWEQLHELYQYSEIHKLKHLPVFDPFLKAEKKSTIEDEYLRACLIFLAEPYHLRPGEISIINQHIERWYGLARLEVLHNTQDVTKKRFFVIELDKDQPPQLTGRTELSGEPEYMRLLNLDDLLQKLNDEYAHRIEQQKKSVATQKTSEPGIRLLHRIIEAWSHKKNRRFPRQQVFKKVNVTIGLHDTHRQLMYELFMNDSEKLKQLNSGFKKPAYESIDIKSVSDTHIDVWATVYNWANENNTNTRKIENEQNHSIFNDRVREDSWTLLNESANGFSLLTVEKQPHKLQVGEIVSIQRPGAVNREIGVVRWLKGYSNTGVEVGCMLLAPSARPVGLITEHQQDGDKVINRGLILPNMPMLNQPETIITFSRSYHRHDSVLVNQPGDQDFYINLTDHVAENENISQYRFVRDMKHSVNETADEEHDDDDSMVFSDVWRNI